MPPTDQPRGRALRRRPGTRREPLERLLDLLRGCPRCARPCRRGRARRRAARARSLTRLPRRPWPRGSSVSQWRRSTSFTSSAVDCASASSASRRAPCERDAADRRLDARQVEAGHRQLVHVEPDEQHGDLRVARPSRRTRPTQRPAACPASTVWRMLRRTAGSSGSYRCARRSLSRSIASVYWVRSFVPIEKKLASRARASAIHTALGVSIMSPISRAASCATPAARQLLAHLAADRRGQRVLGQVVGADREEARLAAPARRPSRPRSGSRS